MEIPQDGRWSVEGIVVGDETLFLERLRCADKGRKNHRHDSGNR